MPYTRLLENHKYKITTDDLTAETHTYHVVYEVRITEKGSNVIKAIMGVFTKADF